MKSKWLEKQADEYVERYASQGVNEDLALRIYSTHLLGGDPSLALHRGGNTRVKPVRVRLVRDVTNRSANRT